MPQYVKASLSHHDTVGIVVARESVVNIWTIILNLIKGETPEIFHEVKGSSGSFNIYWSQCPWAGWINRVLIARWHTVTPQQELECSECWIYERSASHMLWAPSCAIYLLLFSSFGCTAHIRFISSVHTVYTGSFCLTSSPRSNANFIAIWVLPRLFQHWIFNIHLIDCMIY